MCDVDYQNENALRLLTTTNKERDMSDYIRDEAIDYVRDLNQEECVREHVEALTDCLNNAIEMSKRLQAQATTGATWPRVGTLLGIAADLRTVLGELPPVPTLTEAQKLDILAEVHRHA